jgi:hypothetical protein
MTPYDLELRARHRSDEVHRRARERQLIKPVSRESRRTGKIGATRFFQWGTLAKVSRNWRQWAL